MSTKPSITSIRTFVVVRVNRSRLDTHAATDLAAAVDCALPNENDLVDVASVRAAGRAEARLLAMTKPQKWTRIIQREPGGEWVDA